MRIPFAAALASLWALVPVSAAVAQECDRTCIVEVTDAYLAALAANDPSAAPLADDVAFVENVTRLESGEGLWETATIFKIGPEGEVHEIEAVGVVVPYDSPTGWE